MLNQTRFKATIKKGKFIYDEPSKSVLAFKIKKLEGKEVWVSLSQKTKNRSNNQNAYYWGVVIQILVDWSGEDNVKDENNQIHSYLSSLFLTDNLGKIPRIKSTTSLTTVEFEQYLEKVRQWAFSNFNVHIPLPEKNLDYR